MKRRQKTTRPATSERRPLHPALRTLLWLGLICLTAAGIWTSMLVRDRVVSQPRYAIESWRLELVELPAWVTPEIQRDLESLAISDRQGPAAQEAPATLFDRGVLQHIQGRLESSPWVRRLVDLRLTYPAAERRGLVHVELSLRRPVALIAYRGLHYLTDRDGRRLGEPYEDAPTDWFGVPRIVGAESSIDGVPAAGKRWDSVHVENGVWVARCLQDEGVLEEFADTPIEAIDVTNIGRRHRPRDSEIALLWQGCRLTWGQAPLSAAPRTASLRRTLENLRYVLRQPRAHGAYAEIHLQRATMTGVRQVNSSSMP